jgi:hypothetical protein
MSPAELDEKTVLQDPTVPSDPIGLQAELEYYKRKCRELERATEIKEDTYVWHAETETCKKRGHDNVWLFVRNLIGQQASNYFRDDCLSDTLDVQDISGSFILACS